MKPRTVVLLVDDLHEWTGTEVHLMRLLKRLDPGLRAVIAVVGRATLAPGFRDEGFQVEPLEIHRVFAPSGPLGVLRIARLLSRERASLVVCYHTGADLLGPLAARLVWRPVLSCRRDDGFHKKPIHVRAQRPINLLLSGMISVSHAVVRAVERAEGFPARRNQVIWNGEDLERFSPGASTLRGELGLPPGARVVSSVGLLAPVKDHVTQIEAFRHIADRHPHLYLLVAGDGSEREDLERRAAPLGDRVRFLGHVKDVPGLLRASDLYLQTSLTEGFSNAILQAMGAGLPVVVTAVGGNPELVTADTGTLVPPRSPEAIAEALEVLVADDDRRREMGASARRRTLEHFTLDAMAARYADAFERAMEGRFPGPSSGAQLHPS
jgi:glycosyltransferase involved in cell wall biosynthesis